MTADVELLPPAGWHTEGHLTDKSATTYSPVVRDRWLAKGWPVWPLYTADQVRANVEHHTAAQAAEIEALRAERNEKRREWEREMAADGWQVSSHCAHTADSACYCDCGNGGLCEHKWDGEPWQSADGCGWSATCSRCGITAMSHSLRTAP